MPTASRWIGAGIVGANQRMAGVDGDVRRWAAACATNGGPVSVRRQRLVSQMVRSWKSAGSWALLDDAWLLTAESSAQALTSLKQRRLATAVNSPTFTLDRGYAFDGATNYLNSNFIPSSHATVMTGTDMCLGVYERTNLAQNTFAGAYRNSTRNLYFSPRLSTDAVGRATNDSGANIGTVTDSRGMTFCYRQDSTFGAAKNGTSLATGAPGSNGSTLVDFEVYVGALNNVGVAANFRSCTAGAVVLGAGALALDVNFYNALQTFMTAIGANV